MQVTHSYPLVDTILDSYRQQIGSDFAGYRNHVTRMLNICHHLAPALTQEQSKKLQIAGAFHDIALWTHDRVDYLVPSYQVCQQYLQDNDLHHWQQELQVIIDMHHLLSDYQGPHAQLTELFRCADLVDFSLGVIKNGADKTFIKALKSELPNAGFHACLMRFSLKQLFRNPFKPMPMLRIRNIYK